MPAALAVLSLLTFNPLGVIVFGPVAALAALCFYWWRDQIDLATRLLGVAAHGLAANTGVITTTFLLNIASMVAISPLAVFIGAQRRTCLPRCCVPVVRCLPRQAAPILQCLCPLGEICSSLLTSAALPPPPSGRLCDHERRGRAQRAA